MRKRIGIYPGSFDPLTNGHLDIIKRAADLCDVLFVAVACNMEKEPLFTTAERVEILKEGCPENDAIQVVSFDGLLADFCKKNGVCFIVRGLRSSFDYEYESGMAQVNKKLAPEIETLFLIADSALSFVSSRVVRDLAKNGGDFSSFVPPCVLPRFKSKFSGH